MSRECSCEISDSEFMERRLDKLFLQARGYVEHEDDLVDRRLKWAITISGFLFAAYGATWISWPDGAASINDIPEDQKLVVLALTLSRMAMAILGYLSAMYSGASIQAAHLAIRAVTRKYDRLIQTNQNDIDKLGLQVWKLIGDKPLRTPGFASSNFLPCGIAVVWCILAALDCTVLLKLLEIHHNVLNPDEISRIESSYLIVFGAFAGWAIIRSILYFRKLGEAGRTSESATKEVTDCVSRISETSFKKNILEHKNKSLDSGQE